MSIQFVWYMLNTAGHFKICLAFAGLVAGEVVNCTTVYLIVNKTTDNVHHCNVRIPCWIVAEYLDAFVLCLSQKRKKINIDSQPLRLYIVDGACQPHCTSCTTYWQRHITALVSWNWEKANGTQHQIQQIKTPGMITSIDMWWRYPIPHRCNKPND